MKHVFIINPAAGKHDRTAAVTAEVARCCAGMDYEIAVSIAPGDCTRIARDAAKSGQPVRLYAAATGRSMKSSTGRPATPTLP